MSEITVSYDYEFGTDHILSVRKRKEGTRDEKLQGRYEALNELPKELLPDVSSSVGLFTQKLQGITSNDNERLERCLADLLTALIYPHLHEPDAMILIQGPPISKVVGRLAYRYPRPHVTLVFVTVDKRLFCPPVDPRVMYMGWDGPFPDLQEESIVKRFYHTTASICADVFAQALHGIPLEKYDGTVPLGLFAKLRELDPRIQRFATEIRESQAETTGRSKISQAESSSLLPVRRLHGDKAARKSNPQRLRDSETLPLVLEANSVPDASPLNDEEMFKAILGDVRTKAGAARFGALSRFFSASDLGSFYHRREFLRFIKKTFEVHHYRESVVISPDDLAAWFREFEEHKTDYGSHRRTK